MSRRKISVISIIIIALVITATVAYSNLRKNPVTYRTARIERGDLISHVSASGAINPLISVEVEAQVSGVVREIYVDFNSLVNKGQILARIAPSFYELQVKQVKASLEKAQVEAGNKRRLFELYQKLSEIPDRISKFELDSSKVDYQSAIAQVKIAKTELELVEANLYSTAIRSPIDGVIISMNLEVGEAVSPSQSHPLFVIGEDLTRMELEANVSEADIGRIRVGQSVFFTTDAYPDENFKASVSQIRNDPIIYQNVVTYKIVLPVDNKELKLKPGMTAYVNVIVDEEQNSLKVPNIALKFTPTSDIDSQTSEQFSVGKPETGTVWVLSSQRKPKAISVKLGKRNNNFTQVLESGLREGDKVIVEAIQKKDSPLSSIISPQKNY